MNRLFQRLHHRDALAFLWVHVTKGFQYPQIVEFISRTGGSPAATLSLLMLDPVKGRNFFSLGITVYSPNAGLVLLIKHLKPESSDLACSKPQAFPVNPFSFPALYPIDQLAGVCLGCSCAMVFIYFYSQQVGL